MDDDEAQLRAALAARSKAKKAKTDSTTGKKEKGMKATDDDADTSESSDSAAAPVTRPAAATMRKPAAAKPMKNGPKKPTKESKTCAKKKGGDGEPKAALAKLPMHPKWGEDGDEDRGRKQFQSKWYGRAKNLAKRLKLSEKRIKAETSFTHDKAGLLWDKHYA